MSKKEKFDFSREEDQKRFEQLPKEEKSKEIASAQQQFNFMLQKVQSGEVRNYNYNKAEEKYEEEKERLQNKLEDHFSEDEMEEVQEIIYIAKKKNIELEIQPACQKKLVSCLNKEYIDFDLIQYIINLARENQIKLDFSTPEIQPACQNALVSCLNKGYDAQTIINLARENQIELNFSTPEIQQACQNALVSCLNKRYIVYAQKVINLARENQIELDFIQQACQNKLVSYLNKGYIVDAQTIINFARENQIKLDFSTPEIQPACQNALVSCLNKGYIVDAQTIINLARENQIKLDFSTPEIQLACQNELEDCLNKGYVEDAQKVINLVKENQIKLDFSTSKIQTACQNALEKYLNGFYDTVYSQRVINLARENQIELNFSTPEIQQACQNALVSCFNKGYIVDAQKVINLARENQIKLDFSTSKIQTACQNALEKYLSKNNSRILEKYLNEGDGRNVQIIINLARENQIKLDLQTACQNALEKYLNEGNGGNVQTIINFARENQIELNFSTPKIQQACQKELVSCLNKEYIYFDFDSVQDIINFARKNQIKLDFSTPCQNKLVSWLNKGYIKDAQTIINLAKENQIKLDFSTPEIQTACQNVLVSFLNKVYIEDAQIIINLAKENQIELDFSTPKIQQACQNVLVSFLNKGWTKSAQIIINLARENQIELDFSKPEIQPACQNELMSCLYKGYIVDAQRVINFARENQIELDFSTPKIQPACQNELMSCLYKGYIVDAQKVINLAKENQIKLDLQTACQNELMSCLYKGYIVDAQKVINLAKENQIKLDLQTACQNALEKYLNGVYDTVYPQRVINLAKENQIKLDLQTACQNALVLYLNKGYIKDAQKIINLAKERNIELDLKTPCQKKLEDHLDEGHIDKTQEIIDFTEENNIELDLKTPCQNVLEKYLNEGDGGSVQTIINLVKENQIKLDLKTPCQNVLGKYLSEGDSRSIQIIINLAKENQIKSYLQTACQNKLKEYLNNSKIKYVEVIINFIQKHQIELDFFEVLPSYLNFFNTKYALNYPELHNLLILTLKEKDYFTQNFQVIVRLCNLHKIQTANDINKLCLLTQKMGGFLTPTLALKYLDCKTEEAENNLIEQYHNLMNQVLGSEKIANPTDPLTIEAIYLAYRPTGYTETSILDKIKNGNVKDFSHHLDRINFNKSGYNFKLKPLQEELKGHLNVENLNKLDKVLFDSKVDLYEQIKVINPANNEAQNVDQSKDKPEKQMINQTEYNEAEDNERKKKKEDEIKSAEFVNQQKLLGYFLNLTNDDRVNNYKNNKNSQDNNWDKTRLQKLKEICSIIPKEEEFKEHIKQILQNDKKLLTIVSDLIERESLQLMNVKMNKAHFSKEERKEFKGEKQAIEHIIKVLNKDLLADINKLFENKEIEALFSKEDIALMKEQDREDLLNDLQDFRVKMFFDADDAFEMCTERLICKLKKIAKEVIQKNIQPELKKFVIEKTETGIPAKAVISKNIGSFFAKAGAELCTKDNTNIWQENRHYHLNIIVNKQIIGNVMLYFEPLPGISTNLATVSPATHRFVVRGFNPRVDAMNEYDRGEMARELVHICEQIGANNGFNEIYYPPQTSWHALSNRDGMAKEVIKIAEKNCKKITSLTNHPPLEIADADFSPKELNSDTKMPLKLLSANFIN